MSTIEIRRRATTGVPYHMAGHEHDHTTDDFVLAGAASIGPLAYALLRAEGFPISRHRQARADATAQAVAKIAVAADEMRKLDEWRGNRYWRQEARLYFWDQIELLHEVCEELACVFASVSAWRKDPSIDLGQTLLAHQRPAYEVLASAGFKDLDWWRYELGLTPDPDRYALLSPKQQAILDSMFAEVATHLPEAIATVGGTYTKDLNRIAARSRHGISLLDPELGLAWVARKDPDRAADIEALDQGAIAVADADRNGGNVVELLMPLTMESYKAIEEGWGQASWLLSSLSSAVAQRAEHPTGLPIVSEVPASAASLEEALDLIVIYTGRDRDQILRERAQVARTHLVNAATKGLDEGGNRAQRRQAAKVVRAPSATRRKR
jgi:hypothetical protein